MTTTDLRNQDKTNPLTTARSRRVARRSKRKEVRTMQSRADLSLWLIQGRRDEEIREAAMARLIAPRRPRPIRRALGHSMIKIGQRLAAENSLSAARSR